ncbi:hypothetical protein [Hymenobacter convexus]|uniref:hypothetical protein n=1 Tax=Hymenobacter sp. CA1UV-4 TaxID=3063782 RepID=UPI002713BACC|nr:hypothetical protein [Hymenobacter sp. CA1UV-4]MDO7850170.1 hypothetical protein [Hymenobacter sp. CA1UV-4]
MRTGHFRAVFSSLIGAVENDSALAIPVNSSAALAQLAEHTSRYVEAGWQGAPNTAKAYAGDLKRCGA